MPPRRPLTLRLLERRQLALIILTSAITALIVGAVVAWYVQNAENDALHDTARTAAIEGCDGTNLLRGDARLLVNGGKPVFPDPKRNLADFLLRVRDCAATYDEPGIVTVPLEVEYAFTRQLVQHHRVAIRQDGHGGYRFEPIS